MLRRRSPRSNMPLEHRVPLLLLTLLTALGLIARAEAKRDFEMVFDNCTCTTEVPEVMSVLDCGLSKSAKRRSFSIELQFNRDIPKWFLNLVIVMPHKPNDFVLLNLTNLDGCKLLSNKKQVTLMQLGRETLERYSNIPRQCPFLKDRLYYIRGFRFDMDMLPALRFETSSRITYEFLVDQRKLMKGFITNSVVRRKGRN